MIIDNIIYFVAVAVVLFSVGVGLWVWAVMKIIEKILEKILNGGWK